MSKNNSNDGSSDDTNSLIYLAVFIICFMAIGILYGKYREIINSGLGYVAQVQLIPFVAFFEVPEKVFDLVTEWRTKGYMGKQPFDSMVALMSVAGRYFGIIIIPVCLICIARIYASGVISKYNFRMTATDLIRHNSLFMPCLRPVADCNILDEPLDSGPWRVGLQALQFAVENRLLILPDGTPVDADRQLGTRGLVLTKEGLPWIKSPCLMQLDGTFRSKYALSFDPTKAQSIFEKQLGSRFTCKADLADHTLALSAAFMAFGSGHKDIGQALLDQLSTTFSKTEQGYSINIEGASGLFDHYWELGEIQEIVALHGEYVVTFLMGLLMYAKQKGVLASSQFIWLKPYDRTLWYALNQMGGKATWAEAAGPWAHYQSEELLGESIVEKQCQEAVNALQYVLEAEGWLPPEISTKRDSRTAHSDSSASKPKGDARAAFQKGGRV